MERILKHINKESVKDLTFKQFKVAFKPIGQLYKIDSKEAFVYLGGVEKEIEKEKKVVNKPAKNKGA